MSAPERWETPKKSKVDGWYEVPRWVMERGAIPHPRHKWTLPCGAVVQPGQTIINHPDGLRIA